MDKIVEQRTKERIKKLKRWNDTGYYEQKDDSIMTEDTIKFEEEIKWLKENGFDGSFKGGKIRALKNRYGNNLIFATKNGISHISIRKD